MSVRYYHYLLQNNPEERGYQLLRLESPESRILTVLLFLSLYQVGCRRQPRREFDWGGQILNVQIF